ncbi:MAG: hypothetical protein M0C28_46455 [Candidatus Moduliflexus flocculans]|nr:hypothetical protein [Candidatus Moduliflexus flocculans]
MGASNFRSPSEPSSRFRRVRHWILGSISNRNASWAKNASSICCRAVTSTTKMPRPWVATTRSLSRGWTRRSWTSAFGGRPLPNRRPG